MSFAFVLICSQEMEFLDLSDATDVERKLVLDILRLDVTATGVEVSNE